MRGRSIGHLAIALGAAACSSSGGASPADAGTATTLAPIGEVKAFSYLTNSIPTTVRVGSASGLGVIDTGDPWALFDPTTFPETASFGEAGGTVASVTLGGESTANPYVYGTSSGNVQATPVFTVDANVGCSVLCSHVASLNYRDVVFTLDDLSAPSGVGAATSIAFSLEGGDGTGDFPASRLVVTVSLEGADYQMIVDSGATDVTVSEAAFEKLTADGRAQTSGSVDTTSGTSTSSLTRAASVILGGVEVDGVLVAHDPSFDTHLASVSSDVGSTIDGSLGGAFLNSFFVTIDYAKRELRLARYDDDSFILDQGEHLGFTLGVTEAGVYEIATVSGDAATKGVTVGDVVLAISGTSLASVGELEVAALIYGKVGALVPVTFGAAAVLANQTVDIEVEETLPLPSK